MRWSRAFSLWITTFDKRIFWTRKKMRYHLARRTHFVLFRLANLEQEPKIFYRSACRWPPLHWDYVQERKHRVVHDMEANSTSIYLNLDQISFGKSLATCHHNCVLFTKINSFLSILNLYTCAEFNTFSRAKSARLAKNIPFWNSQSTNCNIIPKCGNAQFWWKEDKKD